MTLSVCVCAIVYTTSVVIIVDPKKPYLIMYHDNIRHGPENCRDFEKHNDDDDDTIAK